MVFSLYSVLVNFAAWVVRTGINRKCQEENSFSVTSSKNWSKLYLSITGPSNFNLYLYHDYSSSKVFSLASFRLQH